jgi:hypothetical protein
MAAIESLGLIAAMPLDLARYGRVSATLIEEEFEQEKASALGRLGRRLEAALEALAAFDSRHVGSLSPADRDRRTALVSEAGHALWLLVVQREACGLRDSRTLVADYRVPRDVQAQAGTCAPERLLLRRRR